MRIISGSAKGKKLSEFDGCQIRPTSDRVREALFSMLFSRLGDFHSCRVLDLYAGSGALSLEALSRGASHATLIDESPQAVRLIEHNARACRLQDKINLLQGKVLDSLPRLGSGTAFNLIFVDPPYDKGLLIPTLEALSSLGLLASDGILCVETSAKDILPDHIDPWNCVAQRRYGATRIALLTRHQSEESRP